ncbi:uncharacterized protein ACBR49_020624 [Aulostomus maculatus]
MTTTVKSLKVTYNPINEENTFTSGDTISGQVTLEVAKECQIDSLAIKFKGKSEALWSEREAQTTVVYHSKDKYFSFTHDFVRKDDAKDNGQVLLKNQNGDPYSSVVAPGCHVYPFTFKFPRKDMPSSFKGAFGKIVYQLEAKLSRSMRVNTKDSAQIKFVTAAKVSSIPDVMTPQHESKEKKMRLFNSGTVSMEVNIEKTGFFQGEGIKVFATVQNHSSREIKPKYHMYSKQSFFAAGKRNVLTRFLLKEVGNPIPASSEEKVMQVITIPPDTEPSIFNCSNIKLEYRLKFYLDVKFARDPEVKFDIIILPASEVHAEGETSPTDSGSFGFEALENLNAPAVGSIPPPPPLPQPAAPPQTSDPTPAGEPDVFPPVEGFISQWSSAQVCAIVSSSNQLLAGLLFCTCLLLLCSSVSLNSRWLFRTLSPSLWEMTIKNFSIEYDAINSRNIFTNGDTINGRIILEASKETQIQSLVFIGKGKARVCWSEHYGQNHHHVYWADEKYYDLKHHILRQSRQDGTEVIGKGRHVFPFSFTIPDRKMPSSFKSSIGKIVHKVKAELKQSMRLTKKAKTHFTFVSKADMDIPGLMEPQYSCKDKTIKLFGSGTITMDVHTKRMGYKQGEPLTVTAEISNQSKHPVKPKFILYEKRSFFAQGRRRVSTREILKEKVDPVGSCGKETLIKEIVIPRELPASITNCAIIKLEYRLKIHLDVKYTSDPEIKLPIVILPAIEAPAMKQPPAAGAAFGFEGFGNPSQPTWGYTPQQQATPQFMDFPPPYGAHAMYPSLDCDKNHSGF